MPAHNKYGIKEMVIADALISRNRWGWKLWCSFQWNVGRGCRTAGLYKRSDFWARCKKGAEQILAVSNILIKTGAEQAVMFETISVLSKR